MSLDTAHDPFFRAITSSTFHRRDIADLAAGRCVAIRVPGFMPAAQCAKTLDALTTVEFESYGSARVYPPVMRFGVAVSDHRRDGGVADTYWSALEDGGRSWNALGLDFDPFQACRLGLGTQWPQGVSVARLEGREMAAGVAREPNHGFLVHFDDSIREFDGDLLDDFLVAQFAFNLYLSVPAEGGETVVWRHLWQPSDEEHRLDGSYGYDEIVVRGAESFEMKPAVGEAVLFNPRYFHAVRPSRGARRIALGFSLGMSDTGKLLAWG